MHRHRAQYRAAVISLLVGTLVPGIAPAQSDSLAGVRRAPAAIRAAMRDHFFDPRLLDGNQVRELDQATDSLARLATSRREFVDGFNRLWRNGPASHVQVALAPMPAAAMATYVDTMRVGPGGVALRWEGDIAILDVRTMNGVDTRERISAFYREIVHRRARGLIIDLRNNEGGTFAVVPLVGHLLEHPLETGVFLGRRWVNDHGAPPRGEELTRLAPWTGWSLERFRRDVESAGVLRVQLEPMTPRYAGPVVILTSSVTASAAELAADALLASGRAVSIGERTAGRMLSQRMVDVPGGLHLYIPIADYHSARIGRIENAGTEPTVSVPAADALAVALARLQSGTQ